MAVSPSDLTKQNKIKTLVLKPYSTAIIFQFVWIYQITLYVIENTLKYHWTEWKHISAFFEHHCRYYKKIFHARNFKQLGEIRKPKLSESKNAFKLQIFSFWMNENVSQFFPISLRNHIPKSYLKLLQCKCLLQFEKNWPAIFILRFSWFFHRNNDYIDRI